MITPRLLRRPPSEIEKLKKFFSPFFYIYIFKQQRLAPFYITFTSPALEQGKVFFLKKASLTW